MSYEHEMAGRVLTVERVRELNAKDFFYQILKENPEITKIYPGIEDPILEGSIDHHIHCYPDFVYRSQDMIDCAIDAAKAKMQAIAFKDHYNLSGGEAYLAQQYIDGMVKRGELEQGVTIYGGIGLNFGVRPDVVKVALKYPNMKMLWFPTFNSAGFFRTCGMTGGVHLVDAKQNVLPEVVEVMQMAKEAKVGIGLGHTDFFELLPLSEKAREIGCRCVLDHPLLELNKLTFDEMKQLAANGVYVGTYCQPMIPSIYQPVADPFETVRLIKHVGAECCIVGGDFGQVLHINSIDGLRVFVRACLAFGIDEASLNIALKDNPRKLLYLDDAPDAAVEAHRSADRRQQHVSHS